MEIPRDRYLNRLMKLKNNGSLKIITGMRRCGKSYLLFNLFINNLLKSGVDNDHIIAIALDSFENRELCDTEKLYDEITTRIKDSDCYYIILDEIQMVEGFESLVNGLSRRKNVDIYITGSNSRFLSSDIITEFRGRGTVINVRPLSFSEFLFTSDKSEKEMWYEYLTFGGLPESAFMDKEEKIAYLKRIIDTAYLRDIVERRKIRNEETLNQIFEALSSSIGSLTNPHKLQNILKGKGNEIREQTVANYIHYLEEAFIFEKSHRFNVKGNEYFDTPVKYYATDLGLRNAKLEFRQNEYSHLMENALFNELKSRGFDVDVGVIGLREYIEGKRTSKQLEIDFVANKGDLKYYIQSAFSSDDETKKSQEIRPFLKLNDGFKKIIVTGDDVPINRTQEGIVIVNVIKFMKDENILEKL